MDVPRNVSLLLEDVIFYDNTTVKFCLGVEDVENQTRKYLVFVLRGFLNPVLCVWTILTGIVNVTAFYRIGLKDGVNQNFFILSLSDALQGILGLGENVCHVLNAAEVLSSTVSFNALRGLFNAAFAFPLSVSCVTTTVIAVVRCCCVTMPFTVQKTFTARRQLAAILILCGAIVGVLTYIAAHINPYDRSGDLSGNTTYRVLKSETVSKLWDGTRIAVMFSSFTITFISMLILISALKKSSRFQEQRYFPEASTSSTSERRNIRDIRIIRGIFQVLATFTLCNFCAVAMSLMKLFGVSLWKSGQLRDEYFYLLHSRSFFFHLNTSVNIFVYYYNNSRFKKETKKLLRRNS
ncbi:chemosensory receptor B [Elysia marginata]|uniref:Chemosensory receptor B n=1 Tax=Elysia marginata TaxID=1093978 RepID=A0AAV4GI38_9GAST|nr:chemosensory receptor B [Elysia marginata]